jgi:two-component system KDP operon response regulator KdpE
VRAWMRRTRGLPYAAVENVRAGGFLLEFELRKLHFPDGMIVSLTSLEAHLLLVLMSQPGHPVDSATLVDRVWGSYGGGDNVMLKNLVYRLRRKVESDPTHPVHLLQEAKLGYRFYPD